MTCFKKKENWKLRIIYKNSTGIHNVIETIPQKE